MTRGLHEDFNETAKIATREMLDFIVATKRLPRDDAYMLLSAAMELHVTLVWRFRSPHHSRPLSPRCGLLSQSHTRSIRC